MVLPVVAYGSTILRKTAQDINPDYPELNDLISSMWETMYASSGVGLAAPQINKSIRLFIIDATPFADEDKQADGFKKVFINAHIVERIGDEWVFNEGCLSLPEIREDVSRPAKVRIKYLDENFEHHDDVFEGIIARIIQHEYDHLDGILFVDRLSNLRKLLLKRKLSDISQGKVQTSYKMKFPVAKTKK